MFHVKHKNMQEIKKCPICNSEKLHVFMELKDYSISKEDFTIKKCDSCGFKITSPQPSESELPSYYKSEDYVSHNDSNKGVINYIYQKVKSITLKQKERLLTGLKTEKTILDIGCGTGDFLKYLSDNNWDVRGLEPDEGARKLSLQKLPGKIFPIESFNTQKESSFGIITMWHVLEHVSEINEYMIQLNKLLKQDGRLIIALPNPDSKDAEIYKEHWAAYDVPRHLYHFSKTNIVDLAKKHGFKIESIKPMVFDSFYVSMLSEKFKNGNILKAASNGLLSNIKASKTTNHSSLIYIFSKNS